MLALHALAGVEGLAELAVVFACALALPAAVVALAAVLAGHVLAGVESLAVGAVVLAFADAFAIVTAAPILAIDVLARVEVLTELPVILWRA